MEKTACIQSRMSDGLPIQEILLFLHAGTLSSSSLINRQWAEVASASYLWECYIISDFPHEAEHIKGGELTLKNTYRVLLLRESYRNHTKAMDELFDNLSHLVGWAKVSELERFIESAQKSGQWTSLFYKFCRGQGIAGGSTRAEAMVRSLQSTWKRQLSFDYTELVNRILKIERIFWKTLRGDSMFPQTDFEFARAEQVGKAWAKGAYKELRLIRPYEIYISLNLQEHPSFRSVAESMLCRGRVLQEFRVTRRRKICYFGDGEGGIQREVYDIMGETPATKSTSAVSLCL